MIWMVWFWLIMSHAAVGLGGAVLWSILSAASDADDELEIMGLSQGYKAEE